MIDALILDLDNCLASASEAGSVMYDEALTAIRRANDGSVPGQQLDAACQALLGKAYDVVARDYGFTPAMTDAGWRAFASFEVNHPMHGYGDLDRLADIDVPLCLVTSGFRRLQESKIRALGIAAHFRETVVDAIDETPRLGKRGHFERLIETHGWNVSRVWVVGDSPASELAAGRAIGAVTVQTLRPGVERSDIADHHVADLGELVALLRH
ncbi:MAG: HAD family hydrolase [Rhodanobacter sp.]